MEEICCLNIPFEKKKLAEDSTHPGLGEVCGDGDEKNNNSGEGHDVDDYNGYGHSFALLYHILYSEWARDGVRLHYIIG